MLHTLSFVVVGTCGGEAAEGGVKNVRENYA